MKIPPSKARTIHWLLVFTLLLSLLTGCASTSDVSHPTRTQLGTIPASHPERGLGSLQGYLDKQAVLDSVALLPPPPPSNSAAFAHDGEVARSTFAMRGTPRFELAVADYDLKIPSLVNTFSCAINAQITEANAPYLYTVLRRSSSDLGASTGAAKEYYNRLRPFQLNHEPIGVPEARAFLEKNHSYPSGHTAIGWGFALILSEIAPDRANELLARGRAFGESRTIVNHHWYSDVVWGRFMGAGTVARLHGDPTFRADMDAARVEFAAIRAQGLAPARDCKAEAAALAQVTPANEVTAIDILLEPDATMLQHAAAVNARLLKAYPKGFALDALHTPHITLIQRYVRTADLDKVYAATGSVLSHKNIADWKLKAFKYYYLPDKDSGVAGIVIKPTAELLKLQQELIDAVAPYGVDTGTAAAFATTPESPAVEPPALFDYVATFVSKYTGEHFNPHVTVGVAPQDYLKGMLAEPFKAFTFSPASASIYQLGSYGTAMKKLNAWDLTH
ncbi:MAG: phosphatase PAP2 family protein [Methylococcales bacterium]|nr:phosphatase PAP2 family protein [Methylococcales bacterium]